MFFIMHLTHIYGQSVVINEFMSDNETILQDEDGEFSDWIELYNKSNNPVNLFAYSLSDDATSPDKWTFPNIHIPADSFLIIFASGKDRLDTNELHTNFKINKSGEELIICDPEGNIIQSVNPVSLIPDNSYGCIPDGSANWYFLNTPTPNHRNTGSNYISCSHKSGFYKNDFYLTLTSSDANLEIYYTLNGEIPTKNSLLYSSPLHIESNIFFPNNISTIPTTPLEGPDQLNDFIWKEPGNVYKANIIRFASFDDNNMKSQVNSKTYFVDPEIDNHYTFPIISIITNSLNLFDYETGIYIPGKTFDENGFDYWPSGNYHNRGREWERDIHISYFENNGTIGFETDAGMRMRGYGSASNPQKSFGVYFRSEYGLNKIEYPIFKDNDTITYKRLIFRNSGNDFIHTHFKDALLQSLLKSLDTELQDFQPAVVFFNGEYWGIHGIRQKYDEYYFKYHFGIDEDNINILGICGGVEEGSNIDYLELINYIGENDMSLTENYSFAKDRIDIQNFIDFQIAEIYYANYDWPCNNFKIWKTNDAGSKWRFLIYDLDFTFAYDNNSLYSTYSMEHAVSTASGWPYCECSNFIFRKLLNNEEFKQQFIERFAYHLNTTFNSTSVIDSINIFENLFIPEIKEHIDRWSYPSSTSQWYKNVDVLRDFAKSRPCFMRENIMNFFNLSKSEFDFYCSELPLEKEIKFFIVPNPSNGIFYMYNNSPEAVTGNIRIISLSGKVLYTENNLSIESKGRHYFNLTGLLNNTYILNFYNATFSENLKITIIK